MLTLKDDDQLLVERMIDFVEENWSAFIFRMKECGYNEKEVENMLAKLRKKL